MEATILTHRASITCPRDGVPGPDYHIPPPKKVRATCQQNQKEGLNIPMNEKTAKAESAVLDAVIQVCEGYPSSLGHNGDGEFLMACCEILRLLFDEKRAL